MYFNLFQIFIVYVMFLCFKFNLKKTIISTYIRRLIIHFYYDYFAKLGAHVFFTTYNIIITYIRLNIT